MSLKMHVREYQINYIIILVQFLLIATVECTNLLRSSFKYNKGLYPSTGPLDYQPGLSLEDCVSLCWEEDGCKSVNYHRHATLCELNRVDSADFASTDFKEDTGSIYSEKRSWAEEEVQPVCLRRKRLSGAANDCRQNMKTSYCPDPEFNEATEVVLGNLRKIGNKIRYACIVQEPKPTIFPVGVSTCQENHTWSQTWRPCRETGKNYALNKPANQSSTQSEKIASLAVDGNNNTFSHTKHPNDTGTGEEVGRWYVDMEEYVVVAEIVVYLRKGKGEGNEEGQFLSNRFRGIKFTVARHQDQTGRRCAFFEGPISDPFNNTQNPVRIKCRIPQVGRFVYVTASVESLEMCELEVYTKRNPN